MRPIFIGIQEGFPSRPLRLYQSVRSRTQVPASISPCSASPFLDALHGQQVIRIGSRFAGTVNDIDGSDKILGWNSICGVVGMVLAGNPVTGRIEMGAGMLAKPQSSSMPRMEPS